MTITNHAQHTFDFVVVGGGTSGCLLASRLASSPAKPTVLLLETGTDTRFEDKYRVGFDRVAVHISAASEIGYDYQAELTKGRQFPYARGKGLGGSMQVNFCCWSTGPKDDYDLWAELVGDDAWCWENANKAFQKIRTTHVEHVSEATRKYVELTPEVHADSRGEVDLEYPYEPEPGTDAMMQAAEEFGWNINRDNNSGNPIGFGLFANTYHNGLRVTSANAFLANPPNNLTIWTQAPVAKLLFDGVHAVGVQLCDERVIHVKHEVIMSAGAIDTPKLLMLSGVGPEDELRKHNIKPVKTITHIGKNLGEHVLAQMAVQAKTGTNEKMRYTCDVEGQEAARKTWATGRLDLKNPYRKFNDSLMVGFFKHDGTIPGLEHLDETWRKHVQKSTVPHFELCQGLILPFPGFAPNPEETLYNMLIMLQNPMSRGQITLTSTDPQAAASINLNMLTHPYDISNCIATGRKVLQFIRSPGMQEIVTKELYVPESDNDEDILEFIKSGFGPTWHASGTAKMGKDNDSEACVDTDLRVMGLKGLRVADTSVMPFVISNHTMSTALLIGQIAAEKLIKEYGLDK